MDIVLAASHRKQKRRFGQLKKKSRLGGYGDLVQGKTLVDACERYMKEIAPTHKGCIWEIKRIRARMNDAMFSIQLIDLCSEDIDDWISRRMSTKIMPSTMNRELNLVSAIVSNARRWKWCANNPVSQVDRPRNPPPRDKRYSETEIERILDALEYEESEPVTKQRQEIAIGFLLAIETAMRQGEIWGLDWSVVDLPKQFVTLPETKNGSKRDVPLSTRAVALLEKLSPQKSGRVFTYNQQSSAVIFRRSLQLAGIENRTFHDARHEALTRLAQKLDVLDLARMVGHRDPRSLMIYYNASATEIAGRLG